MIMCGSTSYFLLGTPCWYSWINMEKSASHRLYNAHSSLWPLSCPTPPTFVPSHTYVWFLQHWPCSLASFLSPLSLASLPSFFSASWSYWVLPFLLEEVSPLTSSLSAWSQSLSCCIHTARLYPCPFLSSVPTETLHSNAHIFFFWNQASCSVFTIISRYLMQKKKRKKTIKNNDRSN